MSTTGFYTAQSGAGELLEVLYKTSPTAPGTRSAELSAPYEYLGDSRRENQVGAHAEPVEFKGIRIKDWIIGSNKTHITPIESLDRYARGRSVCVWQVWANDRFCANAIGSPMRPS